MLWPALEIGAPESWAFAQLSGDFNPLHLDAQAARRLQFGGTVCHGVHLVLRALEVSAAAARLQPERIDTIDAVFHASVLTGSSLNLDLAVVDGQRLRLVGSAGGRALFTVKLGLHVQTLPPGPVPADAMPEVPALAQVVDFPDGRRLPEGQVPVRLNRTLSQQLFPALSAAPQGLSLIAELACTTRIVGMSCPGQHSIYAELHLERHTGTHASAAGAMPYWLKRADPRFRSVRIEVLGPSWRGVLQALFRAPPVAQPALAELASLVAAGRFAGQRALVVGGSRGLGELTAKLLLVGGAEVTLTYAGGQQDADRVCHEAAVAGFSARAWRLDLLSTLPDDLASTIAASRFTHLYHFATPQIAKTPAGGWSSTLFDRFSRFYVHGFAEVVRALAAGNDGGVQQLLYPSTVFLDVPAKGFAEYCAAKAAGEVLAEHLALTHRLRVHTPRLPRLQTDQNSSYLGVEGLAPLPVLLALLQDMQPSPGAGTEVPGGPR